MSGFPTTRYSVIERIHGEDADTTRHAFGDLVQGYWQPVYAHLRLQWRLSDDQAQELTQAFFAEAFQKEWLARFEPGKARFRTFVRMCADRFVMKTRQSAARLKRGGEVELLSLDFSAAETALLSRKLARPADVDDFFRREFVRALFERTVTALRSELRSAGQAVALTLFERYDVDPEDGVSYAALARELALTPAQVTNLLAHARRRFRVLALDSLRSLCGTDEEFRREARDLFGLDVA